MKNFKHGMILSFVIAVILATLNSCSSGSGEIIYPDGSKYIGHYIKNEQGEKIKDGEGTLTYSDGKKYVGLWVKNELSNGSFYAPNGELIYQGEWKGEKYNGKGQLYPKQGELAGYKLDGHFLDGKANGFGTLFKPDSTKEYEGYWKDFQYDGNGTFYLNGKKLYEGNFKNGQADGKGTVYAQDGQLEGEGEFKNFKLNGYGRRYANGKLYYEGYLIDNLPDGKGTLYDENGKKKFEGQYKKGIPNGYGVAYNKNGEKEYEGQFVNGAYISSSQNHYSNIPNNSSQTNNLYSLDSSERISGYYQMVERYSMNPAEVNGQFVFIMFNKQGLLFQSMGTSYSNAFSDARNGISTGRIKTGNYSISGTTISVRWDDGRSASWTLSHVNGSITLGGDYQLRLVEGI